MNGGCPRRTRCVTVVALCVEWGLGRRFIIAFAFGVPIEVIWSLPRPRAA